MSARQYLDVVVLPNAEEFEANFGSVRHAYNAALSIDCLAAQIFHDLKAEGKTTATHDSAFRQELAKAYPDFGILRDVAKAMKHVELDQHNPTVSTSAQVVAQTTGWGEGRWGEMRWGGPTQVHVRLDNGDLRAVDYLVRNAITILTNEMHKHRIY